LVTLTSFKYCAQLACLK